MSRPSPTKPDEQYAKPHDKPLHVRLQVTIRPIIALAIGDAEVLEVLVVLVQQGAHAANRHRKAAHDNRAAMV